MIKKFVASGFKRRVDVQLISGNKKGREPLLLFQLLKVLPSTSTELKLAISNTPCWVRFLSYFSRSKDLVVFQKRNVSNATFLLCFFLFTLYFSCLVKTTRNYIKNE